MNRRCYPSHVKSLACPVSDSDNVFGETDEVCPIFATTSCDSEIEPQLHMTNLRHGLSGWQTEALRGRPNAAAAIAMPTAIVNPLATSAIDNRRPEAIEMTSRP